MAKPKSVFDQAKQLAKTQMLHIIESSIPGGYLIGDEYVARNPTRHDRNPGSFKINIKTGMWFEYATNDGGDIIDLVAYVKGINPVLAAKHILCEYGNHCPNYQYPTSYPPKVPKATKVEVANPKDIAVVMKIWSQCQSAENTPVATYLQARGYDGLIPESIKYHPKLYHQPTSSYYPAMVSAITTGEDNKIIGIHRTYLKNDGTGKADIFPNKMMLGNAKQGAVRLAPAGKSLIIAEGIETTLSVFASTGLSAWAALSASGMRHILVPPLEVTSEIVIAADNDDAGLKAADVLAIRLRKVDYAVKIALPPAGLDFNDLLRRKK